VKVKHLLCNKTTIGKNLKGHQLTMANHKHQALQVQQVSNFVESKFQSIMEEILTIEEKVGTRQIVNFFSNVHFKYFSRCCVVYICLFNGFSFAMVMLRLKLMSSTF
jgi:hypothetical protein